MLLEIGCNNYRSARSEQLALGKSVEQVLRKVFANDCNLLPAIRCKLDEYRERPGMPHMTTRVSGYR